MNHIMKSRDLENRQVNRSPTFLTRDIVSARMSPEVEDDGRMDTEVVEVVEVWGYTYIGDDGR